MVPLVRGEIETLYHGRGVEPCSRRGGVGLKKNRKVAGIQGGAKKGETKQIREDLKLEKVGGSCRRGGILLAWTLRSE